MDIPMRDKLLFWSVVLLSLLVFTSIWLAHPPNAVQKEMSAAQAANTGAPARAAGADNRLNPPSSLATASNSSEQVQLDYLYADWCPHCQATRPVLMSVATHFGTSVNLNEWNEALRASDPQVAAIYAKYKGEGAFVGFPTIVAHGPKGESHLTGEQTESEIMTWLCNQYNVKPAACG